MKPLSYRARLQLKRVGLTLLALVIAAALFLIGTVIYLERYVVYTDEEAYLSFLHEPVDETAPSADIGSDFPEIQYGNSIARPGSDDTDEPIVEVTPDAIRGVYLSYADLKDTQSCLDAIYGMEDCNTVLLSLKSNAGNFYYASTQSAAPAADVDTAAVNSMIAELDQKGYRLIARIPAFTDTAFALEHISGSLQIQNGALWMDANGYYWLNPADFEVQLYLRTTALELVQLGVDEIAFADFMFPVSENIVYGELDETAQAQTIIAIASDLINLGAEQGFEISFVDPLDGSPAPSAKGHVFLTEADGAAAANAEETYRALITDASSLVFLTDSHDTRFLPYGILRSREGA